MKYLCLNTVSGSCLLLQEDVSLGTAMDGYPWEEFVLNFKSVEYKLVIEAVGLVLLLVRCFFS